MIRDMSMGDAKFKPGMFVETVHDDANELVINVSLENDHIADIELAARRSRPWNSPPASKRSANVSHRQYPARRCHFRGHQPERGGEKAVAKAMLKSSKALAAEEGGNDAAPKSYDVVVVGSGGAGLAAAIQAHDEGASVLIVEKCQPSAGTPSRLPPG